MISFEQVKQSAAIVADTAVKTGKDLYHKGKRQAELLALDTKLSKAQRQLGALVYSLHKNGEENEELVHRYMETIAAIEREISAVNAAQPARQQPAAATILCPQCGAEVDPDATFCPGCGNKL